MIINQGYFFADTYNKKVRFSKAVLWKDKQISLGIPIINRLMADLINTVIFKDDLKKEIWTFKTKDILLNMVLRKIGQEEQYYFPIDLAIVTKYEI